MKKYQLVDLLCGYSYCRYDKFKGSSFQLSLIEDEIHALAIIEALVTHGYVTFDKQKNTKVTDNE